MTRDWDSDLIGTGIKLVEKQGDTLTCTKDGFTFKVHRSNWPPVKFSPSQCEDPTGYYKFQVRELHGNLYNLDLTEFTGADNEVLAECNKHGVFSIAAKYFKSLRGCPKCGIENIGLSSRNSSSDFIKLSIEKHGNLYDYSLVDYSTCRVDVKLLCREHGEFSINPTNHLSGRGCQQCGRIKSNSAKTLSQSTVIKRFKEKHKDRYDYSLVVYEGDAHKHLKIICKEHGIFTQSYANHNSGKGCPICAREFSPRLKSGFVKSYKVKNYASLYLIRCFNNTENFYKIGITTKQINRRFSGQSSIPYSYELLYLHENTGDIIWDTETKLHKKYKDLKYIPLLSFGGMYECFSYINTREFIENFTDN